MSSIGSRSPREVAYCAFALLSDDDLRLEFAKLMHAYQDECERRGIDSGLIDHSECELADNCPICQQDAQDEAQREKDHGRNWNEKEVRVPYPDTTVSDPAGHMSSSDLSDTQDAYVDDPECHDNHPRHHRGLSLRFRQEDGRTSKEIVDAAEANDISF